MYWACILEVHLNSQKFFSLYCDNAKLYVEQPKRAIEQCKQCE